MAYLIFLSLLECVCVGGKGACVWCVVCGMFVCVCGVFVVCVWCVFGVCIWCGVCACCLCVVCIWCVSVWGRKDREMGSSDSALFLLPFSAPFRCWHKPRRADGPGTHGACLRQPLPHNICFLGSLCLHSWLSGVPPSANCSHFPTQHSWLSSNWPDFLNSFILLTFSSTFLAKILWHNLHTNAGKVAATSFSSFLVHREPWIREGRVRVPLGSGQRQGRLQTRVTRAVPGAACGYCSPAGSERHPALSERKQRGMQKLRHLLREKSTLASIAPLQLHPSMFSAPWLPSWWLLQGGFLQLHTHPALHSAPRWQHNLRLIKGTNQFRALHQHSRLPHRQGH